jgi:uncharacterized protein YraI
LRLDDRQEQMATTPSHDHKLSLGALTALLLLLPLAALAQSANTTRQAVNVRAGPDRAFPVVNWLPARTSVRVFGCTSGRRWCDISAGRTRGWVDARYLSNSVRHAPIVNFSVASYWDRHYRGRPWDSNRNQWSNWGSPSFRPPQPPPFRPL